MDLTPTADQQAVAEEARAFLADRLPLARWHDPALSVRALDPKSLKTLAELGWMAVTLPEGAGGAGFSLVEELLIFRELGRVAGPMCVLTGAVAARAAAAAGQEELAREIASGVAPVAFAARDTHDGSPEQVQRRRLYEADGARWALAADGDRIRVFALDGCDVTPFDCLDKTTTAARIDLTGRPVLVDVHSPEVRMVGQVLVAAVLAGLGETARDLIVDYAKIRTTFGRPIGAYQSVRHPCADMEVRAAQAKCQLYYAALAIDAGLPDRGFHAAAAKVVSEASAFENTYDSIQLHGGVGITDDFHPHILLKRAHLIAPWFGDARQQLDAIIPAPSRTPQAEGVAA